MTYPTVFANLAAGNEPLSLFDTMFSIAGQQGNIPCTASGTNTLTLTPGTNYYVPAAYTNAQIASFKAVATSTGAMTIQIGGLALLKLFTAAGVQCNSGDVVINTHYAVQYWSDLDSGNGGFIILNATVTAIANPVQGTFKNLKITNGGTPNTQVAVTCRCGGGTERRRRHRSRYHGKPDDFHGDHRGERARFRYGGLIHLVCRLRDLQLDLGHHGGAPEHQFHISGVTIGLYLCGKSGRCHYRWLGQPDANAATGGEGAIYRRYKSFHYPGNSKSEWPARIRPRRRPWPRHQSRRLSRPRPAK